MENLEKKLAEQTKIAERQVKAVVELLASGNTMPFIARYRKEATGGLDEVQIRDIEEKRSYFLELHQRRETVIASIESQGKLTPELSAQIWACESKTALEDLYLPFKPKRRTRAMIAREKGLEALALRILAQTLDGSPEQEALAFISEEKGVADGEAALHGARDIVAEIISERADIRAVIRSVFMASGFIVSKVRSTVKEVTKFEQYYDYKELISTIPSHRLLAILRGQRESVLRMQFELDTTALMEQLRALVSLNVSSPFAAQLMQALDDAYDRLICPSVEIDITLDLKLKADRSAVDIFAENLRNILLAAPMGAKNVIGIDPGLRTGCKCVAVSETGKYLGSMTIFLVQGERAELSAQKELLAFIEHHQPEAIAVGNGTGGRETEAFVRKLLSEHKKAIPVVAVSESGASVYSASDIAREELPDLDLTLRGAVSIARRLQDPLAELVKVEPKALGVGQYQHDVYQPLLDQKLSEVVESCVNLVGVELNTASAPLLAYVAGIGPHIAKKIVAHREHMGAFSSRKELLQVAGIGARTFEQAAGFLRIQNAKNPLDASAVHPERYELVEKMAHDTALSLHELVGNAQKASNINLAKYQSEEVGILTLKDILEELKKPGRDPRSQFSPPAFREDVNALSDLKKGMSLEGVVTNVTAFGAFVDVGVHQDGLVHISELSDVYVTDPNKVVRSGDKIRVTVLEVDVARKRISLSARTQEKRAPEKKRSSEKATLGSLISFREGFLGGAAAGKNKK